MTAGGAGKTAPAVFAFRHRLPDIVDEGFDAGVRVGTVVDADMIAVWLTPPEPLAVICSPAYVERYGAPDRPRDLAAHRCILLRRSGADIGHWRFVVEEKSIAMQVAGPLITNDCEACIQAALCGVGLFCLPRSVVCDHLANGDLVTVLDPYVQTFPGPGLYYPSRRHLLPKLRAFIDFATERMRAADFH
jgi:DNA-binding transcriptional LysR family regulator